MSNEQMRRIALAVTAAWTIACTQPPPLPEPAVGVAGTGAFPVAARPLCDERLTAALEANDPAAVRQLATAGVSVSCSVETQVAMTALDRAVIDDRVEVVRALLEVGADPNLRWSSHGDRFPLQQAIESASYGLHPRHRTEIIAMLLRHGADPDAAWCPFESRVPIYAPGGRQILQPGCTAATGVTPLRVAAELDQTDTVALLLHAGADAGLVNRQNSTALDRSRSASVYGLLVAHQFGSEAGAIDDYRRRNPGFPDRMYPGDSVLTTAVAGRLYGFTRLPPGVGS
ncbi:MAG: ankyrin repeat domain-containing protein [Vicinamibacterales bacterium]